MYELKYGILPSIHDSSTINRTVIQQSWKWSWSYENKASKMPRLSATLWQVQDQNKLTWMLFYNNKRTSQVKNQKNKIRVRVCDRGSYWNSLTFRVASSPQTTSSEVGGALSGQNNFIRRRNSFVEVGMKAASRARVACETSTYWNWSMILVRSSADPPHQDPSFDVSWPTPHCPGTGHLLNLPHPCLGLIDINSSVHGWTRSCGLVSQEGLKLVSWCTRPSSEHNCRRWGTNRAPALHDGSYADSYDSFPSQVKPRKPELVERRNQHCLRLLSTKWVSQGLQNSLKKWEAFWSMVRTTLKLWESTET